MAGKIRVLMVDDDELALAAAKRVLRLEIDLETAPNAVEGIRAMKERGPFAVVISDYNMPGVNGAAFLAQIRQHWPLTSRILLTGAADQTAAIDAVNQGHIHHFLRKPCPPDELLGALKDGARMNELARAEKELLEQTLSGSVKMLMDVVGLAAPKAQGWAQSVRRWAGPAARLLGIGPQWQVEIAAALCPLGDIALPPDLIAKRDNDRPLSEAEAAMLAQSPQIARDLIGHIPRLAPVAEAIYYCRKNFDGEGPPDDARAQGELPAIARLLRILIDVADLTGPARMPSAAVWAEMKSARGRYDPEFLDAIEADLANVLKEGATRQARVSIPDLHEGDRMACDLVDAKGRLILSVGNEVNGLIRRKLLLLAEMGGLPSHVEIWRAA